MRALIAILVVAGLSTACGDDAAPLAQPSPGSTMPTVTGATGEKPAVTVPDAAPPATLQQKDIIVGTGDEATAGSQVTVHYVGIAWSTKVQFDASWDNGSPFPFPLGARRVIAGWDQGVAGMKVGGRRLLVIPPDLGYGAAGFPPDIAENETLVFVVDLLSVG